jgi:isoamylase
MRLKFRTRPGSRFPAGATPAEGGVNFSIYSPNATAVELLLYEGATDPKPTQTVELREDEHRDYFFWHVFVEGARPGLYYTWRVDGPHEPSAGFLFGPDRELLDPWAREVSDDLWTRTPHPSGHSPAIRARVTPRDDYDWQGDEPISRRLSDEIVYEIHVRGFTQHASSGVARPGTFAGIVEKIPDLESLGITCLELLPVMAFDVEDVPEGVQTNGLRNYWGYSTYAYHALQPGYGWADDVRTEFRDMVAALHRAGIAVILDVVFNHTAEGGQGGPVISFKGIGNEFFYHLEPDDRRAYRDYTGCGNTLNCNHPFVVSFIVQCLEYWVTEMHVDGFRFDLASVMTRDQDGEPTHDPPLIWAIEYSPILRERILIAEPWDAAGLYQVGDFPGYAWSDWNGRYRDSIRRFLRGDGGLIGEVATRLSGSSDLYARKGRGPGNSINFVTCHDGFTLADLVSYDEKHNEANGENNEDGENHNWSWNSGVEGPSDDPEILTLRERRARNFMAVLMLSQGVPMFAAGDESLRSQGGNNNAYCQDNELSWLDWSDGAVASGMRRFTQEVIALRKRHPSLRRDRFIPDHADGRALHWSGADGETPDWHDPEARILCFTLAGLSSDEPTLHVMMNMSAQSMELVLPRLRWGKKWARIIDTSLPSPQDIVLPHDAQRVKGRYSLEPHTVAVFEST